MEAHPDIHPDEIRFFEQAERTTLLPLYALLRQALRALQPGGDPRAADADLLL